MMRSLSSAVAGLRSHQVRMDVIGNNIANVNTNGFKASRMTFSDVYYQTLNGGSAARSGRGGQNPTQIGYGSQVSTIDMHMTNGGNAFTGRPYDVYIDGDGFFTVKDADDNLHYTRLGNLTFDESGFLVDYTGNKVMGLKLDYSDGLGNLHSDLDPTKTLWDDYTKVLEEIQLQATGPAIPPTGPNIKDFISNVNIGKDGSITSIVHTEVYYRGHTYKVNEAITLGKITVATFANPYGLQEEGRSYFAAAANSGNARFSEPGKNGLGPTVAGSLEMANVELSQEFTDMITTQRGFQANTRIITVSDEMLQELVNLKR